MLKSIELKQIQDNPEILLKLPKETLELIITNNHEPIYKLIRINQPSQKRRYRGSAKGLIKMSADFDEPLAEFAEYM
jgi:antitoxin (DNA-binding transcriptional repressor) of toxin-antitoxin stability system